MTGPRRAWSYPEPGEKVERQNSPSGETRTSLLGAALLRLLFLQLGNLDQLLLKLSRLQFFELSHCALCRAGNHHFLVGIQISSGGRIKSLECYRRGINHHTAVLFCGLEGLTWKGYFKAQEEQISEQVPRNSFE